MPVVWALCLPRTPRLKSALRLCRTPDAGGFFACLKRLPLGGLFSWAPGFVHWSFALRLEPGGGCLIGGYPKSAAAARLNPHLRAGLCIGFKANCHIALCSRGVPLPSSSRTRGSISKTPSEISVKLADKPDSVRWPFLRKTNVTAINLGRGLPRRLNATYPPALRNHINAGLLGIAARRDCPFHPNSIGSSLLL